MRLRKPNSGPAEGAAARLRGIARELLSIGREMVRIPAGLFMRLAELAGAVVLRGWEYVWPVIRRAGVLIGRAYLWLEREVTPARAAVAVTAFVAVSLALSQFGQYHSVAIGVPEYSEVESVAPPPPVEAKDAGTAHLWLGIPLALVALAILWRAATGRWQIARMLVGVGLVVLVISLAVDMPKGLDEGDNAIAYEGAEARLEAGFYVQLICGALLIFLGPLLTRLLEPRAREAAAGAPRRAQRISEGLPAGLRAPRLPQVSRPRIDRPRPTPEARG